MLVKHVDLAKELKSEDCVIDQFNFLLKKRFRVFISLDQFHVNS